MFLSRTNQGISSAHPCLNSCGRTQHCRRYYVVLSISDIPRVVFIPCSIPTSRARGMNGIRWMHEPKSELPHRPRFQGAYTNLCRLLYSTKVLNGLFYYSEWELQYLFGTVIIQCKHTGRGMRSGRHIPTAPRQFH